MTSRRSLLGYAAGMKEQRQELLADIGAFEKLAEELIRRDVKRIYVIVAKPLQKLKLCDRFLEILQEAHVRCFVSSCSDIATDQATIKACTEECRTYNCEVIVAFGGGKTIDVGKMVSVWVTNQDMSLYQMRGVNKIPRKGIPLYVAATTGSGAESSASSLIRHDKQIYMYYSEYLLPRTVVLDPDLVLRLPMENMANASILALTHAVEAYICPDAGAFPADRANADIAVPIFFSYLEKCYKHGLGNDVYLQLMMAPYYSGVASRRIGYGYTHSFALYIAEKYDIAPGSVCAVLLPIILEYEFEQVRDSLADLAKLTHLCSSRATKEEAARAFIDGFRSLCRRVELPDSLPFLKTEDLGEIIELSLYDAKKWGNPKKLNKVQALSLLRKARYKDQGTI
ncbi:MAG: iron-containing alcohol dehydrogenase [Clostridiales bacterium]|nr:iron-containing alcohol dehydrogenase [Clostridiales bacterium]